MHEWAEFRHFKYLLTILELQGFRAAAERLNTGQPNLSMQAKQFQEYASVRLYDKAKDGRIKPTDTGVAFQFIARSVLEARDEALEALIAIERGEIASIRFGCSPMADQALFTDLCRLHKELLPRCEIRPERGDTMQLVDGVLAGDIDAAIVTLPLKNSELRVEELRRDRLVACLRNDDALASEFAIRPEDLNHRLRILYHPQRHPDAHGRLLELLSDAGVYLEEYSRASHPAEMQALVKDGFGVALIREGAALEGELTTRPIAGVDWTVDTAVVYRRDLHPKTIPVLIRQFKRQIKKEDKQENNTTRKLPSRAAGAKPIQLELLG